MAEGYWGLYFREVYVSNDEWCADEVLKIIFVAKYNNVCTRSLQLNHNMTFT